MHRPNEMIGIFTAPAINRGMEGVVASRRVAFPNSRAPTLLIVVSALPFVAVAVLAAVGAKLPSTGGFHQRHQPPRLVVSIAQLHLAVPERREESEVRLLNSPVDAVQAPEARSGDEESVGRFPNAHVAPGATFAGRAALVFGQRSGIQKAHVFLALPLFFCGAAAGGSRGDRLKSGDLY